MEEKIQKYQENIFESIKHNDELCDYKLTHYECYLIVQNGDPRKVEISLGQSRAYRSVHI